MKVTDPQAIRAMAHPVRLDLLGLLVAIQPATAAECGRRLGFSQATCSFHLRQLERYGFVHRSEPLGDGRERPWRLVDLEQSWTASSDDPSTAQLDRVLVQHEADRRMQWIAVRQRADPAWVGAAFFGGASLPMTIAELDGVALRLREILEPFVDRIAKQETMPEDARIIRLVFGATPLEVPDPHAREETSTTRRRTDNETSDHAN